jgi:hypothetical protein
MLGVRLPVVRVRRSKGLIADNQEVLSVLLWAALMKLKLPSGDGLIDGPLLRVAEPPLHHKAEDCRALAVKGGRQLLQLGQRRRVEPGLVPDTVADVARLKRSWWRHPIPRGRPNLRRAIQRSISRLRTNCTECQSRCRMRRHTETWDPPSLPWPSQDEDCGSIARCSPPRTSVDPKHPPSAIRRRQARSHQQARAASRSTRLTSSFRVSEAETSAYPSCDGHLLSFCNTLSACGNPHNDHRSGVPHTVGTVRMVPLEMMLTMLRASCSGALVPDMRQPPTWMTGRRSGSGSA